MEISIDGVKVLLNKRRVCIYALFEIVSVCGTFCCQDCKNLLSWILFQSCPAPQSSWHLKHTQKMAVQILIIFFGIINHQVPHHGILAYYRMRNIFPMTSIPPYCVRTIFTLHSHCLCIFWTGITVTFWWCCCMWLFCFPLEERHNEC